VSSDPHATAVTPESSPHPPSADLASPSSSDLLAALGSRIGDFRALADRIESAIESPPPANFGEGVIRAGCCPDLDATRALAGDTRAWIADLERRERASSGVRALKIGYNRVFGYYFEVSKAALAGPTDYYQRERTGAATVVEHLEKLGFSRRQTLQGAERLVTAELQEYELKVRNAQEDVVRLERKAFAALVEEAAIVARPLLDSACAAAELDVLVSFAETSSRRRYCRPVLQDGDGLEIVGGRHPVVEAALGDGLFVPNDTQLGNEHASVAILTGPNMAGKSTYLRQVALICLLAQIGSYVPAESLSLGIVDRIFARVGAQDDLSAQRSTFMVEMIETANILRNATPRSLLVLDEIGRGTSTYDGIAVARAVVEHIHDSPRLGCKTLFATHYHELAELEHTLERVTSLQMEVLERGEDVAFLHHVAPGAADRSYGVHVARLAGVPEPVTRRATQILADLEHPARGARVETRRAGGVERESAVTRSDGAVSLAPHPSPLDLYPASPAPRPSSLVSAQPHPALRRLRQLDPLNLTPMAALAELEALARLANEEP